MKLSTLSTAATLALATPLHAATIDEQCAAFGDLGYRIMMDRQEGVPLSEQMKDAGDVEWTRSIVLMAYERDRWLSEDYQMAAAQNFRDDLEGYCYGWARDDIDMPWH